MKEKKTEVITVRIPPKTKAAIEREAQQREWTTSKMVEKILTLWAEQQGDHPACNKLQISRDINKEDPVRILRTGSSCIDLYCW